MSRSTPRRAPRSARARGARVYLGDLDPTSLDTMIAGAAEQGRRARKADLAPSLGRDRSALGDRDDLEAWLGGYAADERSLAALSDADRAQVYGAAWAAYTDGGD